MNLPIKYRPQTFEEVTGQEHVTQTLKNALALKKISSAYLLSGPRGIGKTTIARIFAKGLNCEKGITPTPCNQCKACREIQESRSLDVMEIDGASNRGIDDVRELREKIVYAPPTGRYRVVIIDEVHMLSTPAFNALLKTLEEPPPHVVFIFATTEPQKVPETVLSRTIRFDLRPLTEEQIASRLKEIAEREGIEIEGDALMLIAEHAGGSLRDALMLLQQVSLFAEGKVKKDHVNKLLGTVDDRLYRELLQLIQAKKIRNILSLLESEVFLRGISPENFVKGLSRSLERLLSDQRERNVFNLTIPDILGLLNLSLELERELRYTNMPKLWIQFYLAKMAYYPSYFDVERVLRKTGITFFVEEELEAPESVKRETEIVERAEEEIHTAPQAEERVAMPNVDVEGSGQLETFLNLVSQKFPLLGTIISRARTSFMNTTLTILVEDPFQMDFLEDHRGDLETMLHEIYQSPIKIEVKIGEPVKVESEGSSGNQWVKKLIEDFDMEVVEDV
jgi:DNA polymerase III subunit gamma/tau